MKIIKGSTYKDVLRWGSSKRKYVPITAIQNSAPCVITCPGHGIPDGWGFQVESVKGMKELRALSLVAEVVDADTIIAVNTNSLEFSTYVSGGVISYNEPVDLTGYSARMHIRESFPGPIVASLTSDDGSIVIDSANFTISRELSATISARAWRLRERSHWNVARIVIDSIFFDLKHCEKSYLSEVKRKQLPTEYVKFTCNLEPTKN